MRAPKLVALAAGAAALAGGVAYAWPSPPVEYSAQGRVWKEIFYEQFALDLAAVPANCLATEVGSLARTVGPLVGERPDNTPGSVWRAMDVCLDETLQNETARALGLGGWSFEDPAIAPRWAAAAEQLGGCVRDAGGWQAIGSFEKFESTCQPIIKALREGGNGA
ncbi:MAG: hypothetical protein ABMA25_11990 [Ilumatobacteraceae bacterium]